MRTKFPALLLCLLPSLAFGQTRIKGSVSDGKDGAAVAGAFVSLYSGDSLDGYAYTDAEGGFVVEGKGTPGALRLVVTMLGYAKKEIDVVAEDLGKTIKVSLERKEMNIKASKIVYKPISEKGDTVGYDVGAFKSIGDRSLAEVIARLPGVEVTDKGTIVYEGRPISRFYIEGLDLLGDRYSVAASNLSPDKVAQVQLLRNHQPVKALEGIRETDRAAMNIVLKDDAKDTWIFSMDAAVGAPRFPLFDGRVMLSNFAKDEQGLYVLKGNNLGDDITEEMASHPLYGERESGARVVQAGEADPDFKGFISTSRTTLPIPLGYYLDNEAFTLSLNHIAKKDNGRKDRVNFNAFRDKVSEGYEYSMVVEDGGGTLVKYSESDNSVARKYFGELSFQSEKNESRRYLSNHLRLYGNMVRKDETSVSSRDVSQAFRLPSIKAVDDFHSIIRVGEGNAVDIRNELRFFMNDQRLTISGSSLSADGMTPVIQKSRDYALVDNAESSYSKKLSPKTAFSIKATATLRLSDIHTAFNMEDFPSEFPDVGSPRNDLQTFMFRAGLEPSMTRHSGRFTSTIRVPAALEAYACGKGAGNVGGVRADLSPTVNLKYSISSTTSLSLLGSYSKFHDGTDKLMGDYVLSSYRSMWREGIMSGGSMLSAAASLRLNDLVHLLSGYLVASVSGYSYGRGTSVYYFPELDNLSLTYPVMYDSHRDSRDLRGSVSKRFGFDLLRVELEGGLGSTDEDGFIQGVQRKYRTDTRDISAAFTLNPAKWLSLEAKGRYVRNSVDQTGRRIESLSTEGGLRVRPVKRLSVLGSINYLRQRLPDTQVTNRPLSMAEVEWKIKEYSVFVECRNLTGAREYSMRHLSQASSTFRAYSLRPASAIIGIRSSF